MCIRDSCWVADVPLVKEQKWYFRELWVDGQRAVRARQPDKGYFSIPEVPDMTDSWEVGQHRFRFNGTDIPTGPFAYGAEAIVTTRWVESRLPLKEVDAEQRMVTFGRKTQWRNEPGYIYWLEGDGRWLDQPGEWSTKHIVRVPFSLYRQEPGLHRRLPDASTGVPGLFLASDATVDASVNGALLSSESAARSVRAARYA